MAAVVVFLASALGSEELGIGVSTEGRARYDRGAIGDYGGRWATIGVLTEGRTRYDRGAIGDYEGRSATIGVLTKGRMRYDRGAIGDYGRSASRVANVGACDICCAVLRHDPETLPQLVL